MPTSQNDVLYNRLCGAYAYGGIKNLTNYLMKSSTKNDKPVSLAGAYEIAKDFEKNVLGKRRYLMRVQGFLYKLFGKYKTVSMGELSPEKVN